jgi:hypothetical protein
VRIWSVLLVGVGVPVLAVAASTSRPPRGFASERFKPVAVIRQFPEPVWHAVQDYVRSEWVGDAGVSRQRPPHICVWMNPERVLAFGGVGADLDFVVYHHFQSQRDLPPDHDHLLVFKYKAGGEPRLAFSCVGDELKSTIAAVRAAIAAGRCKEATGLHETR